MRTKVIKYTSWKDVPYPFKIKILTSTLGVTFETCFENKKVIEVESVKISFIGRQDLIENKKAVGRPKDLLDIENLPLRRSDRI